MFATTHASDAFASVDTMEPYVEHVALEHVALELVRASNVEMPVQEIGSTRS